MTGTEKLPWEMKPWEDMDDTKVFLIWRGRYNDIGPDYVFLSNDSDPSERIELETPEEIDDLIEHLKQARTWLASQASTK